MPSELIVLLLALASLSLADRFAHRDEITARRFRELAPGIVQSPLDQLRNARWHRAGLLLRLIVAVIVAGLMGLALRSPLVALLSFGVVGFSLALWFDILFNVRFGLSWDYTGQTAKTDKVISGARMAALELVGLLVSCGLWLWLIK